MSVVDSPVRLVNSSGESTFDLGSTESHPSTVGCDLAIVREDDGSYSVIILNLPGTGGCGDTKDAAIDDARSALRETIASHADEGESVPWITPDAYSIPEGAERKRILVNV